MLSVKPAAFDPKKTPAIRWAGQEWPIPQLAAIQLEDIYEKVEAITAVLRVADAEQGTDEQAAQKRGAEVIEKIYRFTREQFAMLRDIAYVGLTRAHPELKRAEFDDQPTSPVEMLLAFYVVRRQSGMYSMTAAGDGDAPAGEA